MLRDADQSEYDAPHWQSTVDSSEERRFPYLYTGDDKLQIESVVWKILNPIFLCPGQRLYAKGECTGGYSILPTPVEVQSDTIVLSNVSANNNFPFVTHWFNPFVIQWSLTCDGNRWFYAGTSSNDIYTCLSQTPDTSLLYRSVVHLACSNGGATTADAAVDNTWGLLAGPSNFKGWQDAGSDGSWIRPLYYYQPGTSFLSNATDAVAFLASGTGNCFAWTDFIALAAKINGADGRVTTINVARLDGETSVPLSFLVANWSFSGGNPPLDTGYPYALEFVSPGYDMVPLPPGGNFGDVTSEAGLKGQNCATPSEKFFSQMHASTMSSLMEVSSSMTQVTVLPMLIAPAGLSCRKCLEGVWFIRLR